MCGHPGGRHGLVVSFLSPVKSLGGSSYEEGTLAQAHALRGCQSVEAGCCCFRPVVRQQRVTVWYSRAVPVTGRREAGFPIPSGAPPQEPLLFPVFETWPLGDTEVVNLQCPPRAAIICAGDGTFTCPGCFPSAGAGAMPMAGIPGSGCCGSDSSAPQ